MWNKSTHNLRAGLCLVISTLALLSAMPTNIISAQDSPMTLTPSGTVTSGQLEFRRYCSSCHGLSGKGDGPVASALRKHPKDLTVLSKHNHGQFPEQHVYNVISGEEVVASHGTREMPIWAVQFRQSQRSILGAGSSQRSPQRVAREIELIVNYIKSIQQQ